MKLLNDRKTMILFFITYRVILKIFVHNDA